MIYTHTVRTLMKHRPHLSPRMFRVLTGPACIFNAKLPPAIFPAISFIASHSASLLFIFLTPRKFYIPCFCSFLSLSLSLALALYLSLSLSLSLARSPFSINIAIEIPFRLSIRLLFIRSLLMFSFFHVWERERERDLKCTWIFDVFVFLFSLFFRETVTHRLISSASIFVVKRLLFFRGRAPRSGNIHVLLAVFFFFFLFLCFDELCRVLSTGSWSWKSFQFFIDLLVSLLALHLKNFIAPWTSCFAYLNEEEYRDTNRCI